MEFFHVQIQSDKNKAIREKKEKKIPTWNEKLLQPQTEMIIHLFQLFVGHDYMANLSHVDIAL